MSKTQSKSEEKIVVEVAGNMLLEELEVPELLKEFRKWYVKEHDAAHEASKWKKKKDAVGVNLQVAIEAVQADSVTHTSNNKEWRATLVKGEPGEKLNEDKLRDNLMRMCKLDAGTINKVFAESQDKTDSKRPYVLVTVEK